MGKIKVMSKQLAELIAAGEVIERPSSIVKELVENSIDAGATSITVEIKDGGISYIRVTDNGEGIAFEDIPTAFLRNATSKILTQDDLDKIFTLGFRGEALASISAIAKVDLISKRRENDLGTHFKIEGSEEILHEKCGCPDGTTITIKDIFYNVPARLKFLKKPVTEGNSVFAVINKLALSHPEVSVKFIKDNKQELVTAGDSKLYSAIYTILGRDIATSFIEVDYENANISIKGYVSKPLNSRGNRSFQNFFVNNRYIKSITCTVALEEAFKNSIMTGKFPSCVLNLTLNPATIDVNVHPAKIEVRFTNEKIIFDSVYFAIKNALLKADNVSELKFKEPQKFTPEKLAVPYEAPPVKQYTFTQELKEEKVENFSTPYKTSSAVKPLDFEIFTLKNIEQNIPVVEKNDFKFITNKSFERKTQPKFVVNQKVEEASNVKVLGEVFSTYIVVQADDTMILVDKHAAHERILYEKIKLENKSLDCQMLISPIFVDLERVELDALLQNISLIEKLGFNIIESRGSACVQGVPNVIVNEDIYKIITMLLQEGAIK